MRARTAGAFLIAIGMSLAAPHAQKPVIHTVTIDATSYNPASLTIKTGDIVHWVNKDVIAHTATSAARGGFDSGSIVPGKWWRHRFPRPGTIPYVCTFHPGMKGTLRVK